MKIVKKFLLMLQLPTRSKVGRFLKSLLIIISLEAHGPGATF